MPESLISREIPNLNNIKLKKIKLKIDIATLNNIIGFMYKESVLRTRKVLTNIHRLVNMIDESMYEKNPDLNARIQFIKVTVEAMIELGFETRSIITQYCSEKLMEYPLALELMNRVDEFKITYEESKFLIKMIDDRVNYGYTITLKDTFQNILDDIVDYRSYKSAFEALYGISVSVVNIKRNINSLDSDSTFSLREEQMENAVTEAVNHAKDRNKIFYTGIKKLNEMLSPGYMSKRLYVYLALSGKGKSIMLLKSLLDIRKYNAGVQPKDPSKTPCVLLITMENDVDETIERMFNMVASSDDIRNYTPKQVIKKLKKEGGLTLNNENNIDIVIKYYHTRSISTDDLYGIIRDLYDDGEECIGLVLDYMKRIRPAEKAMTEKEQLKNITDELKTLAKTLDITVITAQQLNRQAASIIEAALRNGKDDDVTRLLGSDNIAGSWEIQENADWTCLINKVTKRDTDEVYMAYKLLKARFKLKRGAKTVQYFNHPFEQGNEIRLIDDYRLAKSLSVPSLSSDFTDFNTPKEKKNAVQRETKKSNQGEAYEPFDFEKSFN